MMVRMGWLIYKKLGSTFTLFFVIIFNTKFSVRYVNWVLEWIGSLFLGALLQLIAWGGGTPGSFVGRLEPTAGDAVKLGRFEYLGGNSHCYTRSLVAMERLMMLD